MKCPACENKLETVDCRGIEIDECINCRGRWFDRDELRKAKDKQDDDIRWLDFDPFGEDAGKLGVSSEGKKCPKCLEKMSSIRYGNSGVIIDKCSSCEGVWLDHGEYERIIRYLEDLLSAKPAKEYAKDTFKEFLEILTGPEGVASEVKDFLAIVNLLQLRIAVEHPGIAATSQTIYASTPFK